MGLIIGDVMNDVERRNVVSELVDRYYELVYRFAYRLCGSTADAEDLAQHVFLIAQSKLEQLRETEKARSWLLTIVRNTFLKQCRQQDFVLFSGTETPEPSVESLPAEVDSERLQHALNEMPEEYRLPIVLFYFEQLSYKEIADQLGVPAGTIMSRLSRGKAYLRKRLASNDLEREQGASETSPH